MAKRKTVATQRREALARKKTESRNEKPHNNHFDIKKPGNFLEHKVFVGDQLKTLGIAGGYYPLLSCDSTNNVMKKLAQRMLIRETLPGHTPSKRFSFDNTEEEWLDWMMPKELPYVITSEEQTAGRGRQSNTWWTGQGALALSMLLDAKQHGLKLQHSALLSLGMGYAVMQALRAISDVLFAEKNAETENEADDLSVAKPNFEIRWPNDVYVNDRKISGILIEAPNMRHIVTGIGVNSNISATDAPEEIRDRIVTLSDLLGQIIKPPLLIYMICRSMMCVLSYFPSDLSELLEMVEENLYQVGKMVNISCENEQIIGKCLGLNPDGSLRVLTESGEKAVISGVVI